MLADRDRSLVIRSVFEPPHYAALVRSFKVYERPLDSLRRYFSGSGSWPADIGVRTPSGTEVIRAYSPHDMFTVHELFCRHDYRLPKDARCVVDIGSNIGISARYFFAYAPRARVHLYEPVPINVERLLGQLAGREASFKLNEAAVAASSGRVTFGVEPTGRYGGIGAETGEEIEVDCLSINDVLEDVLAEHDEIDLLKIDTEGAEVSTVNAIRPELLERVKAIRLETFDNPNPMPERFRGRRRLMIRCLDRVD